MPAYICNTALRASEDLYIRDTFYYTVRPPVWILFGTDSLEVHRLRCHSIQKVYLAQQLGAASKDQRGSTLEDAQYNQMCPQCKGLLTP